MILDCLPGPNLVTTVLIKWWAEGSESERKEMLEREVGGCLLKIEEGAISQGMLAASKSWKKQETILPWNLQKDQSFERLLAQ